MSKLGDKTREIGIGGDESADKTESGNINSNPTMRHIDPKHMLGSNLTSSSVFTYSMYWYIAVSVALDEVERKVKAVAVYFDVIVLTWSR